jgi:farnesyl-diphosphate farnesyltransferase
MSVLSMLTLLITHPLEFRTLIQFWLYHEQKRDISATQEHPTSGWDRKSMRRCWDFLDMTSRSFSAVIKELEGDLARLVRGYLCLNCALSLNKCNFLKQYANLIPLQICLFYLVLRGLDTIEDDMSIPDVIKQPLLRSFHIHTVTPGWTFDGSGPKEKDRQLLVEYNTVVEEINRLAPK